MSQACSAPRTWTELVDYWAGDLDPETQSTLEDHLMTCDACTQLSERVAAITETIRHTIPPLLTRAALDALHARGLRIVEQSMHSGERKEVVFPAGVDLLIHTLAADLTHATRVSFEMRVEHSQQRLIHVEDATFDREAGVVRVACQPHYAIFPPDVVAELTVFDVTGQATTHRYTILHRFE